MTDHLGDRIRAFANAEGAAPSVARLSRRTRRVALVASLVTSRAAFRLPQTLELVVHA